jgi:serine/threonine protein kinase
LASSGQYPGELQEGDLIGGNCMVLDYIGRGAMGHVYRVRHNTLNAEYALKMLSRDQANEEASRLFQREAGAIKILSHPNVVRIYDIGLHGGQLPYYAMELLVGRDLGKIIRDNGPLSPTQAASIFIEVCAGLGYVHERGIVHRDIKPSNIFVLDKVGASGEKVKVVDFGIVSFTRAKYSENQAEDIHGTPFYMSPESCMGQQVDSRSDIYSLGCTMFEALTGRLPFVGKTPTETMEMQVRNPAPTLKEKAEGHEFPAAWETIIAKTMAKEPEDRYQTMDQISKDLAAVISAAKWSEAMAPAAAAPAPNPTNTAPSKSQKSKTIIIAAAAVAGVAVLGGIALMLNSHGKTDPKTSDGGKGSSFGKIARPAIPVMPGPSDELPSGQKVTASLMSKRPFSSNVIVGGKLTRMFDMPTDVVVGLFRTRNSETPVRACGLLKYPMNARITFTPSDIVGKYPDCLKRFQAGDIHALKLIPEACDDQILKATANISDVRRLSIAGCKNLTDASYETLKSFGNLAWFDAADTNLGGPQLAQAGIWKKIEVMTLSGTVNVMPVLEQLEYSKQLQRLGLANCKLTTEQIHEISKLTQLTDLDISQNKLTKQDLATLGTLVHLTDLHLAETGLTGADLEPLKNFKYLVYLDFSGNHITNKDLANLISKFEITELELQDTDLDASIVEVLRGYGPLKKLHIGSKKLRHGDLARIKDGLPLVKVY